MRRTLFPHWSDVPDSWMETFSFFSFRTDPKMYSADNEAFLFDPVTLMKAQTMRVYLERPLRVTSWYRSPLYNAMTPNASPVSEHVLGRAIDFSTAGHDRAQMVWAARMAGFSSFGFYMNFLHVGQSGKQWFSSRQSKELWSGPLSKVSERNPAAHDTILLY